MKKVYFFIIIISVNVILFFVKIALTGAGIIPDDYMGFDVDDEDHLWIGRRGEITVYNNGKPLRTVKPPTNRDYSFILQDDKMIVSCAVEYGKVDEYDLYGNYLGESDLTFDELKGMLKGRNDIERNGNCYTIKNYGGIKPYEIFRNGERVFRMSTAEYIFNGFPNTVFTMISIIICVVMIFLIIYDGECRQFFHGFSENTKWGVEK